MSDDLDFDMEVVKDDELGTMTSESGTDESGSEEPIDSEDEESGRGVTQLERDAFGDLPSDWEYVLTGENLRYIRSGMSASQNQDGKGIPVTRIETIADGVVNHEKVGYVDVDAKEAKADRLNDGDLLFSNINSREQIGKTAIYGGEKNLYHGMNLLRIRYRENTLHPYFAYYAYDSPMAKDVFFRLGQAAVGQSSINQGQLKNLSLPRPPLPEQRKIASVLYTVDQAIQKTEAIIEQAKRVKRGLMQDLFREGLRDGPQKEVRRIGKIPSEWEVVRLGEVCDRITDGTHQSPETKEEGFPYITSRNIRDWSFDLSGMKYISKEAHEKITSRCSPQKGDVLYVKDGANTGTVQVNTLDFEFSLLSSVALIRPTTDVLDPLYLKHLLSWPKFRQLMMSRMSGTGISRLTISKIEKSEILLPPIKEQRRISTVLNTFDDTVMKEDGHLSNLQRLKKGLMQDLLTGEVRTAEKAIEVLDEVEAHG